MTQAARVSDLDQRRRALEPNASFIVQAPAGSGKTELLIQRYLMLLSRVEKPEEIAAITFTRKAAAEMRQRVLDALRRAREGAVPDEPHRALTWENARGALEQDRRHAWGLEDNPARLRIQTIDSLCASLTRQMPVLSAFGAQPEGVEDAAPLYREAARATLALVDDRGEAGDWVARLLSHLDNNTPVAVDLVASMLARRDHWLRNLGHGLDRNTLEASLAAECRAVVGRIIAMLPPDSPVRLAPDACVADCHALAGQLLTKAGHWRKRSSHAQELADHETATAPLRDALHALRKLPPERYSDPQWQALDVILRLLPLAVAELQLVFAARGQADFVEISQRALAALGGAEAPTDLLLALDYRIRHLLIDEFQDTSFSQYRLLEKLTEGWEAGDGRTLFLVGDPMQSIYRFREAEVDLFLRARSDGIGPLALEPLTLSANFRSQAGIVEWVNGAFARVMPEREEVASGAVSFSPSQAVHPAQEGGVTVHAFFNGDRAGEAARVAALVAHAQGGDPSGSIAVLVRSRSHLEEIVPALKLAGLRFRAIEIEPLGHRQAVQDLLALTRAIAHPADRIAWLAVLRAPWCGLTLEDLHALASVDPLPRSTQSERECAPVPTEDLFPETLGGARAPASAYIGADARTVWELLHDRDRLGRLSGDGRARVERARPPLERALAQRLRGGLRDRIEGAWLALGGPACIGEDTDFEDAGVYLDYLESSEQAGEVADFAGFQQGVAQLFALPDLHARPGDVQILTIHKAKGLEFDTVIVPGLGCVPPRRDPSLLLWMERPGNGQRRLLVAPVREAGADRDPIYDYIVALEGEKASHEDGRLLYVAATRAKKHLHLLGDTRLDAVETGNEAKPPASGSLLEKLWPVLAGGFEERARRATANTAGDAAARDELAAFIDQDLCRLPAGWCCPAPPPGASWTAPAAAAQDAIEVEFSWAGEVVRHVGSVVHRWLQRIADDQMKEWSAARLESLRPAFRLQLASRGVDEVALERAADRVRNALAAALDDPRGRWLLGAHRDSRNEYRIATVIRGERRHLVVDRVFTDEQGARWIVDYKTSSHEGGDREAFLDRERERYREQLERYAVALAEEPPGRLGLYFPLLSGWRGWCRSG